MKNIYKGKSILIAIPNHFGLPERFRENLEYLGFRVYVLEHNDERIPVSIKDYIIHAYKKMLHNDRTHKPMIRNFLKESRQLEYISKLSDIDYALFIRPDLFSKKVIEKAKTKCNKTIAYQWDGMGRYELAKTYIDLFDDFYVFDENDLSIHPKLKHTQNFYFDDITATNSAEKNTVFFVGSYEKNRVALLQEIAEKMQAAGLAPQFFINYSKEKKLRKRRTPSITFIPKSFDFKENLLREQTAGYLLDLHNPVHHGLSFRTFESIGYHKKLITNNQLVKKYDFYRDENIFVFEGTHFNGLENFLQQPYQKLPEDICEKYSFTNWISEKIS